MNKKIITILIGIITVFGISIVPSLSNAQLGGLKKYKEKLDGVNKEKKKADKIIDQIDDAKDIVKDIKDIKSQIKNGKSLNTLYDDVKLVTSAYNRCSDFTLTKGRSTVTLIGATDSLDDLNSDLPKSDLLRASTVVKVDPDMCKFVINARRFQDPKNKDTPALIGPGRQAVENEEERKPVKIRFDFDEKAKFARFYYVEWRPDVIVGEFLDLKDKQSRKSYFGQNDIPYAKSGKYYDLRGDDGPITLYGVGVRLIALVQSDKEIEVNTDSPDKFAKSISSAQKRSDVKVAVAWLELYRD